MTEINGEGSMKKYIFGSCLIFIMLLSSCNKSRVSKRDRNVILQKKFEAVKLPAKDIKSSENIKLSDILNYTIVERQNTSYKSTPRMVYRIMLDVVDIPTELEMRRTALYIWENGNKKWAEFTVFMYLPGMNTRDIALGIVEFSSYGLKKFEFNEIAFLGTKWEEKAVQLSKNLAEIASRERKKLEKRIESVRMTTAMKKKIYDEYVTDPLWVYDDGTDKIPAKLGAKYMKKYKLTKNQLADILFEGAEKGW